MPTLRRIVSGIKPNVSPYATIRSDSHPYYPPVNRQHFPEATHDRKPSRKPSDTGHGELRTKGWDPLFAINHTAASLRGNLAQLVRKTWCTSKKIERLKDHLILYAVWHNKLLCEKRR
jgi:hypothetical protein